MRLMRLKFSVLIALLSLIICQLSPTTATEEAVQQPEETVQQQEETVQQPKVPKSENPDKANNDEQLGSTLIGTIGHLVHGVLGIATDLVNATIPLVENTIKNGQKLEIVTNDTDGPIHVVGKTHLYYSPPQVMSIGKVHNYQKVIE